MDDVKICVVGLGYVGLPLAVEFGKKTKVIGFDVNKKRIDDLKHGIDNSNELTSDELEKADIEFTCDPKRIQEADFIIAAVPTPITNAKVPDLKYVESASEIIGSNMSKGSIVVYESTVYPGATEEVCIPILEKNSGMRYMRDFKVGYSPERINPGDKEHTVNKIVKVVAGCDKDSLEKIANVYELIIDAGVFRAKDIRTAEAAKVIENIQRDLNIALMNELSLIFERMGIRTLDVIEAAGTKWNFHKYYPGLVGGHCIGVDPYYLTYKAQELGYNPQIILAGRSINEYMAKHVSEMAIACLGKLKKPLNECNVLILGLTFKENVPDFRNSKAKDIIKELKKFHIKVRACDPLVEDDIIDSRFKAEPVGVNKLPKTDCVIFLVPHKEFGMITLEKIKDLMGEHPILIDVRSRFKKEEAEKLSIDYKEL